MIKLAQEFESRGNLQLAEKIYIESKTPDRAIKMYKSAAEWTQMIRLFEQFRPDHLQDAYLLIARKREQEENLKEAEQNFILAGKWLSAVDMYERHKRFDECVKVLKQFASD